MKNLELFCMVFKTEISTLNSDILLACDKLGINPSKQFSEDETIRIFEIVNKPKPSFQDLLNSEFNKRDRKLFNNLK